MNVPANLKFSESHEWVEFGDQAKCGITDYAQNELSDIVFVELPEIGKQVAKGEPLCVVESVKAASDVYAPISGEVVAVNDELSSEPEKVNADPFGNGYLCIIKPSDPAEVDALLSAEQYTEHIS